MILLRFPVFIPPFESAAPRDCHGGPKSLPPPWFSTRIPKPVHPEEKADTQVPISFLEKERGGSEYGKDSQKVGK